MKIIFLDIDGVLNRPPYMGKFVNKDLCDRLKMVLKKTGAKIVVSSTWRLGMELSSISKMLGIQRKHFFGVTPSCSNRHSKNLPRGRDIKLWLRCARMSKMQIDKFVILDDDNDMLDLSDSLIQTDFMIGLSEENAEEAIKMLT